MRKHSKHFERLNNMFNIAKDLPGAGNLNQGYGARIAAALYVKNNLIAVGVNQMKTHPFQARFQKNHHSIFIHAENHAVVQALNQMSEEELRSSKTSLYIARSYKPDTRIATWGMAKPCTGCEQCFKEYNIKNIYYTLNASDPSDLRYGVLER